MSTVSVNARQISVRGLKRKEVKQLIKDGFNLLDLPIERADEAMDRVFELVLSEEERGIIEEASNRDAIAVWKAILRETFGDPDAEKNSLTSGPGTQTK